MKLRTILVTAILAMPGVALGQPENAAQQFINNVAISDMFEIQSSKLAAEKADAESKAFAQQMIKDHSKTSGELKSIAQKIKATVPTGMDEEHKKKLQELTSLAQGDQFDAAYDKMQVSAHTEAVQLFTQYGKRSDNQELKAWAAKTLPDLQHHLEMAKKLK